MIIYSLAISLKLCSTSEGVDKVIVNIKRVTFRLFYKLKEPSESIF